MFRLQRIALAIGLAAGAGLASAQAPVTTRPTPPIRDSHTPGYVTAKSLPDGSNPPANADGNFIIGPTHHPAPEMSEHGGVPQGTVYEFTMDSADSKIYPGIARDAGTFGTPDAAHPAELVVVDDHARRCVRDVEMAYAIGAAGIAHSFRDLLSHVLQFGAARGAQLDRANCHADGPTNSSVR